MSRSARDLILTVAVLAALSLCGTVAADDWSFFNSTQQTGLGVGRFYRSESDTAADLPRFALGFETKVSTDLGPYVSFFVLGAVTINAVEAGRDYTQWVTQDDEYKAARIMTGLLIPFAFLGDSHSIIGPGLTIHIRPENPAPFVEAGVGLSSVISAADESYLFGSGFFGGAGVDITDRISVGVRAIWTPRRLDSGWTSSSATDAMTVLGMLSFARGQSGPR